MHEFRVSPRERLVLTAIIEIYIATGEPVSSQAVARHFENKEGLSSATIRNEMAELADAGLLDQWLGQWLRAQGSDHPHICVDGKTVRRSGSKTSKKKKAPKGPIHIVSAFAARQRLVLGQVKVEEKSNEIIAIPKLLRMLEIEGAIVTIDAMGCQREISQAILDKKADYVLALKGNQGTLKDDMKLYVEEQKAVDFRDAEISRHKTVDGDHGRIETREITVIHNVDWLQKIHNWPGLKSVVVVESTREIGDKVERETHLYITSLVLLANLIGPMIRSHWMIENGLHWIMDMVFRDDECRVRTANAPANFVTIKHIAYNLMRRATTKDSMRLRRKVAAWDDEFLASLIAS